ncbi:hypothetical protein O7614_16035 [Micromonospora sp. WMMD961]|uniref:NACHT domain-containing protein n=1 Tax=Micromonospora sp. WMMD961 TaxID=3016100 RepID=UPI002417A9DB|nr:hypothetical protein [Micromonospora sp. WMMD961]MDG4781159.1 hypothetical protein [Micromonospora sp. WMMD961]
MPDYRLDGLSPRAFEHLIQSLAYDAITNEITPFGDGPDGGREATFEGATDYGPTAATWSGYGVIQAKFKQRSSSNDGRWAEIELEKELQAFDSRKRKRRIPDLYIFATNVVLTPTQDTGSKDRVLAALKRFSAQNNVKSYDVWDYDKIRTLLDNNERVRAAYAAWITPGDVLMELAKHLRGHHHDHYKIIVNYLQKDILSDQFAKLEQAGHSADEAIPLSQVFVDLPVTVEPVQSADNERRRSNEESYNFTAAIVDAAGSRFIESPSEQSGGPTKHSPPDPAGRYVLIGGPGQGKTTLGQFICQIFRTALLADADPRIIDAPVQVAMAEIIDQWDRGLLPRPGARRIPFRIVLSEFAKKLAVGEVRGILHHLANYISKRSNRDFREDDVKDMLLAYPSVLVLDGLDEVPPSTNREQVLESVRDFRIDVVTEQIDVLIVATSRPQGYNEDFSSRHYRHLYLEPLPREVALYYARRLTQIRFGQEPARFDKVMSRLERALKNSSTARLMRSPLQVTIMTLLVDRMGQPPQERWTLFSEYYNLIYQREIERDIPAASVLRDYRSDIDTIHSRVGLVLQIESERSGGTDSRLTIPQFATVVEGYLEEEGHEPSQVESLRDSIIEAAANRLVFLVGLETGQVGFEIRSLQEFMAAEGLMDTDDGTAQARLRAIASVVNWRNVFLFAAGKAFNDRRHLRDTIGQICVELNEDTSDELSIAIYAGSRLALDLLEDGPAAKQPAMSRTLTRLALKLLNIEDRDLAKRVLAVHQERTANIYIEELALRLGGTESEARRAAVVTARLADLTGTNVGGLVDRAALHLPSTEVEDVQRRALFGDGRPGLIRDSLIKALPLLNPSDALRIFDDRINNRHIWLPVDTVPPQLAAVVRLRRLSYKLRRLVARIRDYEGHAIGELSLISVDQPLNLWTGTEALPESLSWEYIRAALEFTRNPSAKTLLTAAEAASQLNDGDSETLDYSPISPWPLAAAIEASKSEGWPKVLSEIRAGRQGDAGDWRGQEEAWSSGLSLSDLRLNANLLGAGRISFDHDEARIKELVEFFVGEPELARKYGVAWGLHELLVRREAIPEGTTEIPVWVDNALKLQLAKPHTYLGLFALEHLRPSDPKSPEWDPLFRDLPTFGGIYLTAQGARTLMQLVEACWQRKPSGDLLPAFAMCVPSPTLNPAQFPEAPLPSDSEDAVTVFTSIVLDLRRNGMVARVADHLPRLFSTEFLDDPRLLSALRARLDDSGYLRELLLLHRVFLQGGIAVTASTSHELAKVASTRRSNLLEEATWRRLLFPLQLRWAILDGKSTGAK